MEIRRYPSQLFNLKNLGIISLFFVAGFIVCPSKDADAGSHASSQPAPQANRTPGNRKPAQAEQTRVLARYAHLPLGFEVNRGQADRRVKFLSRGPGYALFLTGDEAVLSLRSGANRNSKQAAGLKRPRPALRRTARDRSARHSSGASAVFRMGLVGANRSVRVAGDHELPGKSNYFIGNDPTLWRTNVPTYARVTYQGIYPGVDLVYYGNEGELEYDFVVAPGADPSAIELDVRAAALRAAHPGRPNDERLRITKDGDLVLKINGSELRFHKPVIYQPIADSSLRVRGLGVSNPESKIGNTNSVDGHYVLKGSNRVGLEIASHDRSRPLIIDPILSYSTYLGGTNIDGANGIAVAPDGSAFIAGGTFSADFPTAHPLQPNAGGPHDFPQDAFVAKISADGSALLYSTYLGGSFQDVANGIAVDSFGNAYVTGTTISPDFPATPEAWDPNCSSDGHCGSTLPNRNGLVDSDAFVTKLNSAGSAIVYSGFLGGDAHDQGLAIAVDNDGNAYVTGQTDYGYGPGPPLCPPSTTTENGVTTTTYPPCAPFPTTGNAFQSLPVGVPEVFVTKISSSGSSILYSTLLGGGGEDIGYGIAVGSAGDAYVTGLTYSVDFPVFNAFQSSYGGAGDGFFAKIDTAKAGTASLVYSTYLGGDGLDQGNGVALDGTGKAYVAGVTKSVNFPTTAGAFQTRCDGPSSVGECEGDAFVSKLDTTRSGPASLLYSTYLGGSLADGGAGIAVDTSGNAYVTGSTVSPDFPVTGSVFQTAFGGGNADAFVAEVDPSGATLVYSSYLGGTNTDSGAGIAVDTSIPASAFVAGQTCSLDFPLANPLQTAGTGSCDAFISKVGILVGIALNPAGLAFPTQSIGTASQPQSVTLTNGDATLSITSTAVTGTDVSDFTETNTCGASLPAGAQCAISVTFTPTKAGVRRASVTVTDSAPGSPHVIPLTGSTSSVGLSSSSLSFGNQPVGVTSSPQIVRVTNNGTAALTISAAVASGDFAETNNCTGVPLQPTTNCVVSVTYTPSLPGSSVGALTITDNAAGSPQIVLLTGTGLLQAVVTLSTTSLTFANQPIGTTSAVQGITVGNAGTAPLNISGITVTGDFTQTNTCGSSLAVKANCTISVAFTPSAAGPRTGSLTITDNGADSPQVISLGGDGADFVLSASPSSNSVSAGLSARYTITVTPSFGFNAKVTLGCAGGIPRGGTCSVSPATVTPDGTNPITATVTVTTATRSLAPPGGRPKVNWPGFAGEVGLLWYVWMLVLAMLAGLVLTSRRRIVFGLALVTCLVLLWAGCGGGSQVGVPAGTPAGNYTLTLSGASGTVTHNAAVNLTVM